MTNDLEIGQVIVLKMRYNNTGLTSNVSHPYLIVDINNELNYVEIAQIDSLAGKEYKAAFRSNKVIYCTEPDEIVIDKDSYVQLDNTFRLENFPELESYRKQTATLSQNKLHETLKSYREYHENHEIDENKNVYIDLQEFRALN